MWKLWHSSRKQQLVTSELEESERCAAEKRKESSEYEAEFKAEKRKHGNALKRLLKMEKQLRDKESVQGKLTPELVKCNERIKFLEKKLEISRENLLKSNQNLALQAESVQNLEVEKQRVERSLEIFEQQAQINLKKQQANALTAAQELEYQELQVFTSIYSLLTLLGKKQQRKRHVRLQQ